VKLAVVSGAGDGSTTMVDLVAGDVIVLPATSVYRIVNCSATQRLSTLTVLGNDGGFAEMIASGPVAQLDEQDVSVLHTVRNASAA